VGLRLEDQLKMSLENLCFPRQVAGATEKISMISDSHWTAMMKITSYSMIKQKTCKTLNFHDSSTNNEAPLFFSLKFPLKPAHRIHQ
jgi:hypothetical protein